MKKFDKPIKLKSLKNEEYKNYIHLDNMSDDFLRIYTGLKYEHLDNLEKMRKKILLVRYTTSSLLSIFVICMVILFGSAFLEINIPEILLTFIFSVAIISVFAVFIFIVMQEKEARIYLKEYKEKVIPSFVKLLNPNLKYSHLIKKYKGYNYYTLEETDRTNEIKEEYIYADFDGDLINKIEEDERVESDGTESLCFKLTDIRAIQEYRGIDGNKVTQILFDGLFYWSEIENNINNCFKIYINKNNQLKNSKNKVVMDSSEFENVFDVFCEDKILAMRILTTDIMELLIDFYTKYYVPFEISCRNNKLYVRFFVQNMFEPTITSNAMDIKSLYMYYVILDFTIQLTKKINKTINKLDV